MTIMFGYSILNKAAAAILLLSAGALAAPEL